LSERVERNGLRVDAALAQFLEAEVLAPLGRDAAAFWAGFADLLRRFAPRNLALLDRRDELQAKIDRWHAEQRGKRHDAAAYRAFLEEIGYLQPEPAPFEIGTTNVDPEIAALAGPQLVVPVLNARFVLNAANARWGSLYDAYYGTDALPHAPAAAVPGLRRRARRGGDRGGAGVPRPRASADDRSWSEIAGAATSTCASRTSWSGARKGLGVLQQLACTSKLCSIASIRSGATIAPGIADVRLEAALTTIVDLEDSVAAVDAGDKLLAYRNWLGVIRGDLEASFDKGGRQLVRKLEDDLVVTCPDGREVALPGRSLLFVRNVGHLMTNPAVLMPGNGEIPEGIMDAVVTSAIGALDVEGRTRRTNSRCGSIYIVKPRCTAPRNATSPTTCSTQSRTCSASSATPSRSG
jgi:malate synthase